MKIEEVFKVYGATEHHSGNRVVLSFPNSQSYIECKEKVKKEGIEGFDISCFDTIEKSIYVRASKWINLKK